jgi:hypothetical protein
VAIAALVQALARSGRVAILRWVQRENSVSPGGVGWWVGGLNLDGVDLGGVGLRKGCPGMGRL